MRLGRFLSLLGIFSLLACCSPKGTADEPTPMTRQEREDAMIERNREFLKNERLQINSFIDSTGADFQQTGSGLYYTIIKRSENNSALIEGDFVEFEYEIKTIAGNFLESSVKNGNKKFALLRDDEIVGLHEGISLMHLNDEFLFIIPAHLAYGLGSQNTAPLNATLLYNVKIVSIN